MSENIVSDLINSYKKIEKQKFFLLNFYESHINMDEIKQNFDALLLSIEKKLMTECKHNYVDDEIDIDYDTSKKITYCDICSCTFTK